MNGETNVKPSVLFDAFTIFGAKRGTGVTKKWKDTKTEAKLFLEKKSEGHDDKKAKAAGF